MVRNKSSLPLRWHQKHTLLLGFSCASRLSSEECLFSFGTAPEQNEYITLPWKTIFFDTNTVPIAYDTRAGRRKNREYNIFREAVRLRTISAWMTFATQDCKQNVAIRCILLLRFMKIAMMFVTKYQTRTKNVLWRSGLLDLATAQRDFENAIVFKAKRFQKSVLKWKRKKNSSRSFQCRLYRYSKRGWSSCLPKFLCRTHRHCPRYQHRRRSVWKITSRIG